MTPSTRRILKNALIVGSGICVLVGLFLWRPLLLAWFGVVLGSFPLLTIVRAIETTRRDWAQNRAAASLNLGVYGCVFLFSLSVAYMYTADVFGKTAPRIISKLPGGAFSVLALCFIALGCIGILSIGLFCARTAMAKIREENYAFASVLGVLCVLAFSSLFLLLYFLNT